MAEVTRDQLLQEMYGEIAHNVNPVVGYISWDSYKVGKGELPRDTKTRPTEPCMRKAAEAILDLLIKKGVVNLEEKE